MTKKSLLVSSFVIVANWGVYWVVFFFALKKLVKYYRNNNNSISRNFSYILFCFYREESSSSIIRYNFFISLKMSKFVFFATFFFCRHCCAKNSFFCFLKPTPNILNKFCNFSWNHFHEIFLFWFFFSNNNWLLCDEED